MIWIKELFAKIPKDKFGHYVKGQFIFLAALFVSGHALGSFLMAVFLSIIWEFYQDATQTGKKETSDILADMAGSGIGYIIYSMHNLSLSLWH